MQGISLLHNPAVAKQICKGRVKKNTSALLRLSRRPIQVLGKNKRPFLLLSKKTMDPFLFQASPFSHKMNKRMLPQSQTSRTGGCSAVLGCCSSESFQGPSQMRIITSGERLTSRGRFCSLARALLAQIPLLLGSWWMGGGA